MSFLSYFHRRTFSIARLVPCLKNSRLGHKSHIVVAKSLKSDLLRCTPSSLQCPRAKCWGCVRGPGLSIIVLDHGTLSLIQPIKIRLNIFTNICYLIVICAICWLLSAGCYLLANICWLLSPGCYPPGLTLPSSTAGKHLGKVCIGQANLLITLWVS